MQHRGTCTDLFNSQHVTNGTSAIVVFYNPSRADVRHVWLGAWFTMVRVAATDALEEAVNIVPEERTRIRRAMHSGWPDGEHVALLSVVDKDEEDQVSIVLRLTPRHRFLCKGAGRRFPFPFVDTCGCRPLCGMLTVAALARGDHTCSAAVSALQIWQRHPQDELHPLLQNHHGKGRTLAYCEILFEDAITKAVAIQLPVEGVPEMVAKYALWVFQRMGTVYE